MSALSAEEDLIISTEVFTNEGVPIEYRMSDVECRMHRKGTRDRSVLNICYFWGRAQCVASPSGRAAGYGAVA